MPSEQRRAERAAPNGAGEAAQREERQRRVKRVPQHARRVVPAGIEAEERDVELVRHPGERVPVRGHP